MTVKKQPVGVEFRAAINQLRLEWEKVWQDWRDKQAKDFHRDFLGPIHDEAKQVLNAMEEVERVFKHIENRVRRSSRS